MKKLQNNFTTPEQSKRLLELGVPRWTADEYRDEKGYRHSLEGILDVELFFQNFSDYHPCWSVGRLIEIILICHIGKAHIYFDTTLYEISYASNMDWVIRALESAIKCKRIDFSKLED